MAVKLVVNGYFRSGTTIIWRALKEANPDISVFYEPCHGDLLKHIDRVQSNREISTLHNMHLWDEYLIDQSLLKDIKFYHPNTGKSFPSSITDFIEYINVFDKHSAQYILQSNRWHFYLQALSSRMGFNVIHVIRSPLDVYESIKNKYIDETCSTSLKIIKKIFLPFINGDVFETDNFYEYLFWRYQRNVSPLTRKVKFQKKRWSLFEKFVFVWTLSNYEAIRQVTECDGDILVYEKMENDPAYAEDIFSKYSVEFNADMIINRPGSRFIGGDGVDALFRTARKVGVLEEYTYILDKIIDN